MNSGTALVYPVVHVESIEQVVRDVRVVETCGLSRVFLIHHGADDDQLADAVVEVRNQFPSMAVGVNVIRRPAPEAMRVLSTRLGSLADVWAIWTDTLGLESGAAVEESRTAIAAARASHDWDGTIFGGVAFKYQAAVADADLPRLARAAGGLDVVPTTSGKATGSAPSTTKLRLLREGLPHGRMAVASGVTPENVVEFLPFVTDILVSTGISGVDGRLSDGRLAALLDAIDRA